MDKHTTKPNTDQTNSVKPSTADTEAPCPVKAYEKRLFQAPVKAEKNELVVAAEKPKLFDMVSSPKEVIAKTFANLSIRQIIENKYPSIGMLTRDHGEKKVQMALMVLFSDMSTAFDGELTDTQLNEISIEIMYNNLYRNIRLEGIYLICRKMKSSKTFGKLNVNKVLMAVDEYMEEHMEAAALHSFNQHQGKKHVRTVSFNSKYKAS